MASTPTPPCGLAPIPIPGLPPIAQAVLHSELLLVHVSLAQIHSMLHRPLGIRTTPLMDRVTHPHLRAQLEGLDNTLLLALRVNHTALHCTTPMSSSLPWASFTLYITVLHNLKLNFKAARTLAIVHLFLHCLFLLPLLLQRLQRGLPGLITPPTGCLHPRLLVSCLGLACTYARGLALDLARPDPRLLVSPYTLAMEDKSDAFYLLSL